MTEVRFFPAGTDPEFTTAEWYAVREVAPHLEQPAHRPRLLKAAEFIFWAEMQYAVTTVSDMGCGDGGLLSLLREARVTGWGYDLNAPSVQAALHERKVAASQRDITGRDVQWGDLAVFTEVLEHLTDPHGLLARCPSRLVVASSPNGETAEYHYEFHTWGWDMEGYGAMFRQAGYEPVRHELVGGFQVLLGVR